MPQAQQPPPFWDANRLRWLVGVMQGLAQKDQDGHYFGPIALESKLIERLREAGHHVSSLASPLNILVYLGVLERGTPRAKPPGYKRRFYPEAATAITDERVRQYRRFVKARARGHS